MNGFMQEKEVPLFDDGGYLDLLGGTQTQTTPAQTQQPVQTTAPLSQAPLSQVPAPAGVLTQPSVGQRYFDLYPDIAQAYAQDSYGLTPDQFAQTHYDRFGKAEGRLFDIPPPTTPAAAQSQVANLGAEAGALDMAQVSATAADDPAVAAQNPLLTEYSTAPKTITPFKPTAVVFGDSMSGAVGYNPADNKPDIKYGVTVADVLANNLGVDVYNLASGGETSNEALSPIGKHGGFENYITQYQPQYAILRYGAADAIRNKDGIQSTIDSMTQMVDTALKNGTVPVIVGVSELYSNPNDKTGFIIDYIDPGAEARANQINDFLRNLAIQKGVPFIDVRGLVQAGQGDLFDGVHANVEFGKKMADAISGAISTLGIIPGAKQFGMAQQPSGALGQVATSGQQAATGQDVFGQEGIGFQPGAGGLPSDIPPAALPPAEPPKATESATAPITPNIGGDLSGIDFSKLNLDQEGLKTYIAQQDAPDYPVASASEAMDLMLRTPGNAIRQYGQYTVIPVSSLARLHEGLDVPVGMFEYTPDSYEVSGMKGVTDKGVNYEATDFFDAKGGFTGRQVNYRTGGDSGVYVTYDAKGNITSQYAYDESESWRSPAALGLSFLGATVGLPGIGAALSGGALSGASAAALGGAALGGAGAAVSGAEGSDILKGAALGGLGAGAGQLAQGLGTAVGNAVGPGIAGDIASGAVKGAVGALPAAISTGDLSIIGIGALTGGVAGGAGSALQDLGLSPTQIQGAATIVNQLASGNPNVNSMINAAGQLVDSPNASIAAKAGVMFNLARTGASPSALISAAVDLAKTISTAEQYKVDKALFEAGKEAGKAFPPAAPATEKDVFESIARDQTLKIGAGEADDLQQASALAQARGFNRFEFPVGSGTTYTVGDIAFTDPESGEVIRTNREGIELADANRRFMEQERQAKLPDYSSSDTLSSAAMKAYTEGNTGTFMYKGAEYRTPDAIDIATGQATALPITQMGIPSVTVGGRTTPPAEGGTFTAPDIPIPSVTIDYGGVPLDYTALSPESGAAATETITAEDVPDQGPIKADQTVQVTGKRLNEFERWSDYIDKYFPGGTAQKDSLGNILTPPTFEEWQAMGGRTQPAEVAQIGSDVLKSAVAGAADVAKAPFVLANLIAGKSSSGISESLASYINSVEQSMSPEFKANQALMNKVLGTDPNAWETLKAYAVNPQQVLNFLARTSPTMLAGGAAGLGARLMGAGMSGIETAAIMANAGVHAAQSADSAMEQARQLGYSDAQALGIGRTVAALSSMISAGAQKIVPGAMSIEAKIAGANVPSLIGRETGEAMLSTGQSALRNALVRYGGEIGSENIEEGSSRVMTNLAVGRPWDEGLSRTFVEATLASGGLTAAVDAISKVPTFESLLTQAQADPEGKEFADLIFLGRSTPTLMTFESGPPAIGMDVAAVDPDLATAPDLLTGQRPLLTDKTGTQVATGTALDEQIAREQRVSDIVGDRTSTTQAPTTLPPGATPDMVTFFDEKGTPVTYRDIGLTQPATQPPTTDQATTPAADRGVIDVETRPAGTPAVSPAEEVSGQQVSVAERSVELDNLQKLFDQALFETSAPGVSISNGAITDVTTNPTTNTNITQVVNPVTGQTQVTITDAAGNPAAPTTVVGTDATGNPVTAGAAQSIVSGQTTGSVVVGNTTIASTVDPNTNTSTVVKTDADTGVRTETVVDSNTGTTTKTVTDPTTNTTTQVVTDVASGTTTVVQSTTDAATKVETNTATNVSTVTTTDINTGTTTQVVTDPATNQTVRTETTGNTTTQVTTDPATNLEVTTKTNTNTGVTTQTTVDPGTNTTTQVTTNPNTNTTIVTVTDPASGLEATTKIDLNTGTQTTLIVDISTGTVVNELVTSVTDPVSVPPVDPVPPVTTPVGPSVDAGTPGVPAGVETPEPKVVTPEGVTTTAVPTPVSSIDQQVTSTPTTTPTETKPGTTTKPPTVSPSLNLAALAPLAAAGAAVPRESIGPQFLKSWETQKYIDPLAEVKQAQAELSGDSLMQQIDPRLASILQQRMGEQKAEDPIGALARMLSGEAEEPSNSPYYSYGEEESIDDILGGKAAGFAQGGYVAPLQMAGGGEMPMALMAKEGGRAREDFRHGKHVAGDGDGQSDDIPAWLADGEFVFPADVVSALGNGSTKAGTDKLYEMMHGIRERARSKGPKDLPPPALKSPLDYLKSKR